MNHLIVNTSATVLGTAAEHMDIRNHLYFSFDFIATADIAEGESAVFEALCAEPSLADPCVPGDFEPIPEVMICGRPAEPADTSMLVLEGPIAAGQRCKATIPCACHGFVQVVPATALPDGLGGAEDSFDVIGLVQGPK